MATEKNTTILVSKDIPVLKTIKTELKDFKIDKSIDIKKDLTELKSKVKGIIILSNTRKQNETLISGIRKSIRDAWIPIAIYSETDIKPPLGCFVFSDPKSETLKLFFKEKKRPKLLIIEDREEMQRSLDKALNRYYELTICGDGVKGFQAATNENFDLIITDYELPGIKGDKIIELVRAQGINTPFILMTAYHAKELELNTLSAGAFEYVEKPIVPKTLQKTIVNALINHDRENTLEGALEDNEEQAWKSWYSETMNKIS